MSNRGIQELYYTSSLPGRSVAIAQVETAPYTASQLTDINNLSYQPGALVLVGGGHTFTAPDFNQSITISGAGNYLVENQFFEITDHSSSNNVPLYFYHPLPSNVSNVTIVDVDGVVQTSPVISIVGNFLYHDLKDKAYRVRYVKSNGSLETRLLRTNPVLKAAPFAPSATAYVFGARNLTVNNTGSYFVRFLQPNGYMAVVPYGALPNSPWFPRIRFSLKPSAPEWARQVFLPARPYMLAAWVPGVVLDETLVEFERKDMFFDPDHLPDVLVFDKDYVLKYALEGTSPKLPRRRGNLYPWKRGLIKDVDPYQARIDLGVEILPTDVVYAFYVYKENDIIYRALDVNPFTNPVVKNKIVQFYFKNDGIDPFRNVYHQILDQAGVPVKTVPFQSSFLNAGNTWIRRAGSGTITYPLEGEDNSPSFKCVGGEQWRTHPTSIPYDPSRLYKITCRARQTVASTNGNDRFSCGVEGLASNGTTLVNILGNNSFTSQHNVAALNVDMAATLGVWQSFTGYFSGLGSSVVPSSNILAPATLRTGVAFIRPSFDINHSLTHIGAGDGTMEVDFIKIEVLNSQTNDPAPSIGNNIVFATMAVGSAVGTRQFSFTDVRERGGGLVKAAQAIPQAANFWDLGYWDGKPYPIGAAVVVYLPLRIQTTMDKADITARVRASLPMGVMPVIRYYDNDGNEST